MTPARSTDHHPGPLLPVSRSRPRRAFAAALAAALLAPTGAPAVVATWLGGDGDYDDAFNCDVNAVPLNNGTTYDVVIDGNGVEVTYDEPFAGAVDTLSLGSGVTFLTGGPFNRFTTGSTTASDASLIAEDRSVLVLGDGNLDRSSLVARKGVQGTGGARLTTAATSWNGTDGFNRDRDFSADGADSLLDLSSLTTVERNGGHVSSQLVITASDGGRVDLTGIGGFADSTSGVNGDIIIEAAGAGSVVDISNVTTLSEADLIVRDGGEIAGQLTQLGGRSSLVKRNGGVIDLSALVEADDASLIAEDGAALDLGTTRIDRNDLVARKGAGGTGGATLTTAVTTWSGTSGFGLLREFSADGAGSLLDLSSLTIASDGRFTGSGTVIGQLINDGGRVGPGTSPGTLSVDGSFSQRSGSILEIEIGGPE